jgi:MFS family permease
MFPFLGPGWRWFCWVCVIFTAINFLAVFFFVPETRFYRDANSVLINHQDSVHSEGCEKVAPNQSEEAIVPAETEASTQPLKSWAQQMSLWSGVDRNCGYLTLFFRPFPLAAYPAVIWATISCKTPSFLVSARPKLANYCHIKTLCH